MHRAKRRVGPGHRRRGDAERRVFLQDRGVARIAHGIAGDLIVDEGLGVGDHVGAADDVTAALPGKPHHLEQRAHRQRGDPPRQVDHRRRQHHAVEPAFAGMRHPQHDRAAHRMGQREMRRRTIRQHHLLHEGFDVDLVIGEVADIALARIAQAPRRMSLPAPVDHRHRKAAVAQIAHGLEIFLDLLAAPGEDADRALAARRRRPAREAQFRAVGRADGAGHDVFRDGIGGNRDKRHGGAAR